MMIKCLVTILCKTLFHERERKRKERQGGREGEREGHGCLVVFFTEPAFDLI